MSQRASLIKKIQALLSKTVEAGCTEDEAMAGAALAAANALGCHASARRHPHSQ